MAVFFSSSCNFQIRANTIASLWLCSDMLTQTTIKDKKIFHWSLYLDANEKSTELKLSWK